MTVTGFRRGAAAATGDGEWLGGAGAGVLVLLGHYMHPPAPTLAPHIYYLLSTYLLWLGGQTAGRVQAAL